MLPRLAHVRRAAATATMQQDADIAEKPTIIQNAALQTVADPPRDGDCLFHCFYRCFLNAPWIEQWERYRAKIKDANDMRKYIIRYMSMNADLFEAGHSDYIRNAVARWMKRDVNSLTYEEAMPLYCAQMKRPTVWGGEPELDAGAMLLNVIVNQFFVPEYRGELATARLSASFYPDPALVGDKKKMKAARAPYTKFVFILKDEHYYYVLPLVPRALRAESASDSSASDDGRSASPAKPAKLTKPGKSNVSGNVKGNALLKELNAAREARAAGGADGDACALKPVTLTAGQRAQMEVEEGDAAYARRLAEQELNDAALARELARQWS